MCRRMGTSRIVLFLFVATSMSIAMPSKPIIFDYDIIGDGGGVRGNGVDNEIALQSHDYQDADYDANSNKIAEKWTNKIVKRDPEKYELVFSNDNKKRNILSALRAKIRRSEITDAEEKFKFAPVLSVEALNNLNGFFDNLATNIHTMESRNLLPNQLRLLGESEYRPRDSGQYRHSAAYINSVRSFAPLKSVRKLYDYQPESHRNSNFYDPALTRIGLGR